MAQKPVILLAFANDRQGKFLRSIAAEQRAIRQALAEVERQGFCELIALSDARANDIFETFRKYRGRIKVFHYGGHAADYELLLNTERKERLHIAGFAPFLAEQPGLQLVFLNGCATQGQKEELQAAGIPHVLTTSRAIQDQAAQEFASQFYQSLAHGQAVPTCFAEAEGAVKAQHGGEMRAFKWEGKYPEAKDELPWELFTQPTLDRPWALKITRLSPWLYAGLAVLAVLLAAVGWQIWGPVPQPFDFTVEIRDAQGIPSNALKTGYALLLPPGHDLLTDQVAYTQLSLLLDGEPKAGEVDQQGNVYFRQLDPRFLGATVPVRLEGGFWESRDSVPQVQLSGASAPFHLRRSALLCAVRGKVRTREKPFLPNVSLQIKALPDISRLLVEGRSDAEGRFQLRIPPDKCARQYLVEMRHADFPYLQRDTLRPESGEAVLVIE